MIQVSFFVYFRHIADIYSTIIYDNSVGRKRHFVFLLFFLCIYRSISFQLHQDAPLRILIPGPYLPLYI